MVKIEDLDWDPSKDQEVKPVTRNQCTSCIGPPRVSLALLYQQESDILNITSIQELAPEWKSVVKVSRTLEGTAEEFFMLSCKFLICLCGDQSSYICNPTTGEFRALTMLNQERDGIGFGFDATENQFKLVLLHLTKSLTSCDIFTLGTNSWTTARYDDPCMPTYKGKAYSPTTVRESIYWITAPVMHVLCFNVESRRFKLITSAMDPDKKKVRQENNVHYSLSEVLGDLCMVYHNGVAKRLWVWTLIDEAVRSYNEPQWWWRYNIDLTDFPAHTVPEDHVTLITVRGPWILVWSTWMGVISYFEKARFDCKFDKVLYKASGYQNQTVGYEKSSTLLRDILLLNQN